MIFRLNPTSRSSRPLPDIPRVGCRTPLWHLRPEMVAIGAVGATVAQGLRHIAASSWRRGGGAGLRYKKVCIYIYIIKNPHQLGYDTSTQKVHMSWDTTPLYPLITGTANPCRDIHQSTIFDTPLSFLVLTINHPICGPILSHTHT